MVRWDCQIRQNGGTAFSTPISKSSDWKPWRICSGPSARYSTVVRNLWGRVGDVTCWHRAGIKDLVSQRLRALVVGKFGTIVQLAWLLLKSRSKESRLSPSLRYTRCYISSNLIHISLNKWFHSYTPSQMPNNAKYRVVEAISISPSGFESTLNLGKVKPCSQAISPMYWVINFSAIYIMFLLGEICLRHKITVTTNTMSIDPGKGFPWKSNVGHHHHHHNKAITPCQMISNNLKHKSIIFSISTGRFKGVSQSCKSCPSRSFLLFEFILWLPASMATVR